MQSIKTLGNFKLTRSVKNKLELVPDRQSYQYRADIRCIGNVSAIFHVPLPIVCADMLIYCSVD